MRGSELAEAMVVAVDRLVNARESSVGLDRVIETIVSMNYLEAYKAEMLMRHILVERQLMEFARVVTLSIHSEVLETQANKHNWSKFEE